MFGLVRSRDSFSCIVGCQSVAQQGGLVQCCSMQVPLRLKLISLFYCLRVPIKFEIKNTCLIKLSHFILSHFDFASMLYTVSKCHTLIVNLSVIDIVISRGRSNLGPKAFSLLEFEIAPQNTRPPQPFFLYFPYFGPKQLIMHIKPEQLGLTYLNIYSVKLKNI